MKIKYVIIILIIIKFMADPVWNGLSKTQTDSQTILEAIADLIAEHNNDPDAHNVSGQSLYLHRINDIIDHPAGSVKNDKHSFSDYEYNIHFTDFAYWTNSLFSLNSYTMKAYCSISSTNLRAYILRELPITSDLNNSYASFVLSARLSIDLDSSTTNYAIFGIGGASDLPYADFGFVFKNGNIYISYYDSVASDYVLVDTTIDIDLDLGDHFFRLEYIKSENLFNFYIDGSLVYTLTSDSNFTLWNADPFINIQAIRTGSGTGYIDYYIYEPFLSLDYTY